MAEANVTRQFHWELAKEIELTDGERTVKRKAIALPGTINMRALSVLLRGEHVILAHLDDLYTVVFGSFHGRSVKMRDLCSDSFPDDARIVSIPCASPEEVDMLERMVQDCRKEQSSS